MPMSAPSKYWILPLIAGILYVILGVWVLRTPLESFLALSFLFAFAFLVSGVVEIFVAFSERAIRAHWGWALAGGIIDLAIGLMLLNNPATTIAILPYFVGFALLFRSSFVVAGSFAARALGAKSWGWMMVFGLLGTAAAFILLRNPLLAGFTIVVWTGVACMSVGIARIMAAFALRKGEEVMA